MVKITGSSPTGTVAYVKVWWCWDFLSKFATLWCVVYQSRGKTEHGALSFLKPFEKCFTLFFDTSHLRTPQLNFVDTNTSFGSNILAFEVSFWKLVYRSFRGGQQRDNFRWNSIWCGGPRGWEASWKISSVRTKSLGCHKRNCARESFWKSRH